MFKSVKSLAQHYFSPNSSHFLPLSTKYFSQYPLSNNANLYSSLKMTNQFMI